MEQRGAAWLCLKIKFIREISTDDRHHVATVQYLLYSARGFHRRQLGLFDDIGHRLHSIWNYLPRGIARVSSLNCFRNAETVDLRCPN